MRGLLADPFTEGKHHPFGQQEAAEEVRVRLHSPGKRLEVLDDGAHPGEEGPAVDHELGDRGELHPERRGVAFVFLVERIGEGDEEPADEPPERHRKLGARGVALVRHRAASDLPGVERFVHLADFRALQIIDLVSDFPKGTRNLHEQPHHLGHPVAGRVPADARGSEPEARERPPLHLEPVRAEGRHGADRAGDVADEDPRLGFRESVEVPVDLVDPHRELVAERDGKGVLAMGPPDHQGVAVGARLGGQPFADGAEIGEQERPRLAHHEDHAGVDDVLGGGPVVDVLAGIAVAEGGQGPNRGHEGMSGRSNLAADRVEIDERRVGLSGDLVGRVLRNDTELRLGEREGGLDVEPLLDAIPVGEHGRDPGRREGGAVEA